MTQLPDLSGIRIRYSETDELAAGQHFDTIADFDTALRAASFAAPSDCTYFKVAFVATWTDGSTYGGRIDLEQHAYVGLVAHVAAFCSDVEGNPQLRDLLHSARVVRARMLHAAARERLAAAIGREQEFVASLERERRELQALRARLAD